MNSNNRERVAVGPVFGFAAEGDRREGFSRCNVLRWSRRNMQPSQKKRSRVARNPFLLPKVGTSSLLHRGFLCASVWFLGGFAPLATSV